MAIQTVDGTATASLAFRTRALAPPSLLTAAQTAFRTRPIIGVITPPAEASSLGDECLIVLARLEDFNLDGSGNPESWKPGANDMFGTALSTRELGWGTVLSEELSLRAPTGSEADDIGLLLAGHVGDETETLTVHCDVSLLDPKDKPRTSDIFTRSGKDYCIFSVTFESERDADTEMTVSGIRWNGCTRVSTPAGVTPPMAWV